MPDSTQERERAQRVQERYAAMTRRIREDPDLTQDGRRRRLAQAWTSARAELDKLRADERDRLAEREQYLERRLFGLSGLDGASQAISTRDAQDRASRLSRPSDATELLARAERNGDDALARAVAQHAAQQARAAATAGLSAAWDGVLGQFIDARPSLLEVVKELASIERLGAGQVFNVYSLPRPSDVLPQDLNAAAPTSDLALARD